MTGGGGFVAAAPVTTGRARKNRHRYHCSYADLFFLYSTRTGTMIIYDSFSL